METLVVLNVAPTTTPHYDLEYLPLADKYFQIKDLDIDKDHLKVFCQCRDNYVNGYDTIGLWESNLPIYFLPSMCIFLDIIHHCHANYDPNLRAVKSPNQTVLFTITADSINEMLQFQPSQDLTPISLGDFLEKSSKLSQSKISRLCQIFMDKQH